MSVSKELDLSVIRYSRVEEDHRILSKALQIKPDKDTVLSVTSSGDNVLNLLLERPKKIVAIDMSAAQNSLLELKIAAINHLEYEDYMILLGEVPDGFRARKIFEDIKKYLPKYAQDFWGSHVNLVTNGLSLCGRLQGYFVDTIAIPISQLGDVDKFTKFFEANFEDQGECFEELPLPKLKAILREMVFKQEAGRSAAQLKYTTMTREEMTEMIWNGFCRVSRTIPMKDNFYHSQTVRGHRSSMVPIPDYLLPPHLTMDGFNKLKSLVDRIEVKTECIEDYMSSYSYLFDKMNLSNIFEYMSPEKSDSLFSLISEKMSEDGLIAYWILFNDRYPNGNSKFTFLKDISQELHRTDRIFYYKSFCVFQKC